MMVKNTAILHNTFFYMDGVKEAVYKIIRGGKTVAIRIKLIAG